MARRDDLLEKSLNNIIKYFLCSEHFSDDCFLDPPYNTKLKKTSRPVTVPMPSIFKCNIDQYIKSDTIPLETDAIKDNTAANKNDDTTTWTSNTIDTSQNVLFEIKTDSHNNQQKKTTNSEIILVRQQQIDTNILEEISNVNHQDTLVGETNLQATQKESTANMDAAMDDGCIYLNKSTSFDDIEAYCLSDTIDVSPIYRDNEIKFIIDKQFNDEASNGQVQECNDATSDCHSSAATPLTSETDKINCFGDTCRLCAETFDTDVGLMNIFSDDNDYLVDDINMVMPNMVSRHGFIYIRNNK